jgi:WD40 repeat protein
LSADGRYLAAGSFGGTATVWTTQDGAEYATITPPAGVADTVGEYTHVAFSPDGRTLAHSSLMGGLRRWDVATRTSRAELRGSSSIGTASLAPSPTGDLLAQGGFDSKVVLWDPAEPQAQLAVLTGQTTAVFGLSFGPNGRLAAGTADNGGVVVWDVARRVEQALAPV